MKNINNNLLDLDSLSKKQIENILSSAKNMEDIFKTGKPKNKGELAIGDIRKYYGVLGWKVTPDINFAVEAVHYKISPTSKSYDSLKNKVSSGHLSPWLFLNLSKKFDFILGAVFRTNKIRQEEKLRKARLWSHQGLYGNSVFTKINLNIWENVEIKRKLLFL